MGDLDVIRTQLALEAARFGRKSEVTAAAAQPEILRAFVAAAEEDRERGFFAAICLAILNDRSGLEILRDPNRYFMTNSGIEIGLAEAARVLLGDLKPPIRMINASMMPRLAKELGAWPHPID